MKTSRWVSLSIQVPLLAQITILSTPAPTGPDPTNFGTLWPGGLISLVCTGLKVKKPLVQPRKLPLPLEVEGIRVKVGIGRLVCGDTVLDNPVPPLDAPIIEVADHGDYQQVTVQVPWEFKRYPIVKLNGIDLTCGGTSQFQVSQGGDLATSDANGFSPSSFIFVDPNGYVLAQHAADLSWVTGRNAAHPGEVILIHAANLGSVVNPPRTGYPTPLILSTIIGENGQLAEPIALDVRDIDVSFALLTGPNSVVQGKVIPLSITLEPGTVGRYIVALRVPSTLPPSPSYLISYFWSFCPPGPTCTVLNGRARTAGGTNYPQKIYLTVP